MGTGKNKRAVARLNISVDALFLISSFLILTFIASCGRRADPVYVPSHDQKKMAEEPVVQGDKAQREAQEALPATDVQGTGGPDAPAGLVGLYTGRSVILAWQEVRGQGVKSYRIYRSSGGAFERTGESPTPAFTDGNVVQGVLYRYYVTAVGKAEGPPAEEIRILTEVE
ncbi:MAG: hypothetical protein JSU90_03470 [Nitrospiraceae bacterium]|nr:MAG: hypothetical protein JSU90_03470 [Nitrospiraceae bacterium]